jgi:VWFA-related protein
LLARAAQKQAFTEARPPEPELSRRPGVYWLMKASLLAAGLPILVTAIATAQQDTPAPTFRSGTRLVEVDVVARSKGAPATGLSQDDFTLLDNGKPQKITFFSVQSGSVSASPAPGLTPLAAGVVSNRSESQSHPTGNTTLLFLDQRNTPQPEQAFAIQRIAKFIGTRRQQDRTGIYTFGRDGTLKVVQEITTDSELLSRAAGSIKAQDPGYRSPGVSGLEGNGAHAADELTALLIRTREIDTRQVLEQAARHLANVPGRKSLIWISPAFPLHWKDLDFTPDVLEAARKLNDSGVALYAVDPRGVAGGLSGQTSIANAEHGGVHTQEQIAAMMIGERGFPAPIGFETMRLLAGLTGGLTFANDNGLEKLIQAAAEDGELTYTLGFYPAQEDREGVRHSLKVLVSKPGIGLRYRQNYLASASPDGENPGSWQIKVNVNVRGLRLTHEDAKYSGGIDVSFHVEGGGKVITKSLKMAIPDDQFARYLENGIDTTQTIEATGSAGALRVVVQDRTSGAAGSVTVPLSRR